MFNITSCHPTNSNERNISRETRGFSVGKLFFAFHGTQTLIMTLTRAANQMDSVHIRTFYSLRCILILSSYIRLRLRSCYLLSLYQLQFCVHLSHACYMSHLFRSLSSDHRNKSMGRVNYEVSCYVILLNLLFLSFSLSLSLYLLGPDIFVRNFALRNSQFMSLCSSFGLRVLNFAPIQNKR
jgi:hypothetical protein